MSEKVLTTKGLAAYLGMTYQAAYKLIVNGEILASKEGNRLYIKLADAERWLDEKTRPELCA